MSESIFRKESVDRVNSPEDLNSYMRVTNPPIWFILVAVILLLCGTLIWATTSKIESKACGVVVSDKSGVTCFVAENDVENVNKGTIVRIDGKEYTVSNINNVPVLAENSMIPYCMSLGGFENGEMVYKLSLDDEVPEGNYACEIVLESISPIRFLTDSSN